MSLTKGTPASSQIIWLEDRVKELENEIAALRSEPVAWMYEHEGMVHTDKYPIVFSTTRRIGCEPPWVETPLYAAPSRETDQRSEAERVGSSRPNSSAQSSDHPTAEPALSAEQILAQYDQEIKRGGSTDSIIVRTVQHFTALSSLTARDEGIEAAASILHEPWSSAVRALAQDQRSEAVSNAERVDINQGTSVRPTDKQSSDHPTEVDELLRNGAAGLRGYATLLSFSREVGREEVGRKYDLQADAIDAYLSRKEQ